MTNGKYVDYSDFDTNRVNELLKSTNADDKLDALLYTVLGSRDYEASDMLIFQFVNCDEIDLRRNAVLSIGHLVRIHKQIDLAKYIPLLDNILSDQDEFLVDNAEDALNDIWIFYDKEKLKQINKDNCVGRYFNVLEISDSSQRDESYDNGIRTIKELEKTESNPSILKAQRRTIEYLNNLREASSSPQQNA
jgi:hypothetical protein